MLFFIVCGISTSVKRKISELKLAYNSGPVELVRNEEAAHCHGLCRVTSVAFVGQIDQESDYRGGWSCARERELTADSKSTASIRTQAG